MIDTLQLKKCYTRPLGDDELRDLGAFPIFSRKNRIFALNSASNPTLPRITFIFTPNGLMHVMAECSVPKMLFGHNARLPNQVDVYEALWMISKCVGTATGLDFDAADATVSLVHFTKDVQLGEPGAHTAINQLARLRMKGLNKLFFSDTGKKI